MNFRTKGAARKYIKTHAKSMQKNLIVAESRYWSMEAMNWINCFVVVYIPPVKSNEIIKEKV